MIQALCTRVAELKGRLKRTAEILRDALPGPHEGSYDAEEYAEELRTRVAELEARFERSTDWYQQRFNRLRKWIEEEVRPLSEDTAHRYYAICANGSPAPHESADWADTLHAARLERDAALARVKELEAMRAAFLESAIEERVAARVAELEAEQRSE